MLVALSIWKKKEGIRIDLRGIAESWWRVDWGDDCKILKRGILYSAHGHGGCSSSKALAVVNEKGQLIRAVITGGQVHGGQAIREQAAG